MLEQLKKSYLRGAQLLRPHVCDSEVVVGLSNGAEGYCVGHLGEKSGRWGLGDGWGVSTGRQATASSITAQAAPDKIKGYQ